jgi:hypothetical protein
MDQEDTLKIICLIFERFSLNDSHPLSLVPRPFKNLCHKTF